MPRGTPYRIVGTSSFYKRESFPGFVVSWSNDTTDSIASTPPTTTSASVLALFELAIAVAVTEIAKTLAHSKTLREGYRIEHFANSA